MTRTDADGETANPVRKRLPLTLLAVGLLSLGLSAQALAATRFAVPGGLTTDSSCTTVGAGCSLRHVLEDVVLSGDEVVVMPGVHDSGTNGFVIKSGVTGLNVHGQDGQPRPRLTANGDSFTFNSCVVGTCSGNGMVLRHLAIDHTGARGALAVYGAGPGSTMTIDDVRAVAGSSGPAILIFGRDGIRSSAFVRNTTARSFGTGLNGSAITSEVDLTMRNATAVASGTEAAGLTQTANCTPGNCVGSAHSTVLNSILAGGPGEGDVRTTAAAAGACPAGGCVGNVELDYSNWDSLMDCPGCASSLPGSAHNETAAPLLVDSGAGDFHQRPGSPTIDAGVDDAANGATDADGNARKIGPATDIGAFEDGHPRVRTDAAGNVTQTSATLLGAVNPVGFPTTYFFEWGTTTGYGNRIPATDAGAGSGTEAQAVAQDLAGLAPGTTVHYRLVAANSFGAVGGNDQSFTTLAQFTGVRLRVRTLTVRRGRFIVVPIPCPGTVTGLCAGKLRLITATRVAVPSARRKLTLGSVRFSVRSGTTKRTRLRLTRPARRLVAQQRRLRIVAQITATANLSTKSTRKRLTLKSPRRR